MDEKAVQLLQQRMAELPEDVRTAIGAADLGERIRTVGQKHNLHVDQLGELGDETMLAMLGFSPLESFDKRLAEVLRLTPEAATALAGELNTSIFGQIRDSMKRFAAAKAAPTPAADAKPAAMTPSATPKPTTPPPAMPNAEATLTQKTIQKADPYREPV